MKLLIASILVAISYAQTGRRLLVLGPTANCRVTEVVEIIEGKKCNTGIRFDDAVRLDTPEECAEAFASNLGSEGGTGFISFKNHESDTLDRGCVFSPKPECQSNRPNTDDDWTIFRFKCEEATLPPDATTMPGSCGYETESATFPDGNVIMNGELKYWTNVVSPEACQALCDANYDPDTDTGCNAGSHNDANKRCQIYSDATTLNAHSNSRRTGFIYKNVMCPPINEACPSGTFSTYHSCMSQSEFCNHRSDEGCLSCTECDSSDRANGYCDPCVLTSAEPTTPELDLLANVGCVIESSTVGACTGTKRTGAQYQMAEGTEVDECLAGNAGDNYFVKSSSYQRSGYINLRDTGDCVYSETCASVDSSKSKWTVYAYSCSECSSVKVGDNIRCKGSSKNTAAQDVADTYQECVNYYRYMGYMDGFVSFESRNSQTFCAYKSPGDCDNPVSTSGSWAVYAFDCNYVTTDEPTTTDEPVTTDEPTTMLIS